MRKPMLALVALLTVFVSLALLLFQPAAAGASTTASYIVAVDPAGDMSAAELVAKVGGKRGREFRRVLSGFEFTGTARAAEKLRQLPGVTAVVPNGAVQMAVQDVPTGVRRSGAAGEAGTSAGLPASTSSAVAILDTGIDASHPELNVVGGYDCTGTGSYLDNNGHGTHVAGIVGARNNDQGGVGVAPGAPLWSVKVLDATGNGTWASVICGLDWVAERAATIRVANVSLTGYGALGTCTDGGLRQAVCRTNALGVAIIAAAGNNASNADNYIPAAFPEVIGVGAIADYDGRRGGLAGPGCRPEKDDTKVSYSNHSAVIDVMAPGACIISTKRGGGVVRMSGTSMAAPHVSGAVARYLDRYPAATPTQIHAALRSSGDAAWDVTAVTTTPALDVVALEATDPAGDTAGSGEPETAPSLATTIESRPNVAPGGELSYVVRVTNTGSDAANAVRLAFTAPEQMLPEGRKFEQCVSMTAGVCIRAPGFSPTMPDWRPYGTGDIALDVAPTYVGVLPAGAMWKVTVRGILDPTAPADADLTVTAVPATGATVAAPTPVTVKQVADVAVTLTAGKVYAGKTAFFKVTVSNNGPSAAPRVALATSTAGLRSAEFCNWDLVSNSCTTAWTALPPSIELGDLSLSGSATVRIRAVAESGTVSVTFNASTADAAVEDPKVSNNTKGYIAAT